MQKHAFGKKALTLLLTLCMVFTTIAPAASSVVYADSVSDHTGSSSVSSVDPGNASSVATGGEEQNSGSSSTPTQSQPDSTSNSTSVPAADGGGSDSTSAPPANSSSVPTDNGEETSSSSTSEIPEDSSAPENEDGTGEDESEEDKESEGDNSAEEFIPLAIIDPETGDVIEAEVGDEVTLSSLLNRDDILVVAAGLFCRKMDGRFCRKKPDTDVRRAGRIDVAGVFCRTREGRGQSRSLH